MLRNYLFIAWRNLFKQKFFTLINILGFALALSAVILVTTFVVSELQYDRFHHKSEQIFRVVNQLSGEGNTEYHSISMGTVAPTLEEQMPAIEHATRVFIRSNLELKHGQNAFADNKVFYVDPQFLQIFDFKLQAGDPQTALNRRDGIILSRELAEKVYGKIPALNEKIELDGRSFVLSGIMEKIPTHSSLQFDVLAPSEAFPMYHDLVEEGLEFVTFISLKEGHNTPNNHAKIEALASKLLNDRVKEWGYQGKSQLQALSKMHLYSSAFPYFGNEGNLRNVQIFSAIALLILLLAITNFVNLYIVRSENRGKEIAVRKVLGANRLALVRQFMGEAFMVAVLALGVAVITTQIIQPYFGELMGRHDMVNLLGSAYGLMSLLGLIAVVGFVSGIYPALFLSGLNVIRIFKRQYFANNQKSITSKALIVFQFAVAVFMVMGTLIMQKQIQFMQHQDLGFDKNQILIVNNLNTALTQRVEAIRSQLLQNPDVRNVAISQSVPGGGNSGQIIHREGRSEKTGFGINHCRSIKGFLETYDLKIQSGKGFPEGAAAKDVVLLNESASKKLFGPSESPISQRVHMAGKTYTVGGVIKDYHYSSLRDQVAPLAITADTAYMAFLSIKLAPTDNPAQALAGIEAKIRAFDASYHMEYFFLDDSLQMFYAGEEKLRSMMSYGTFLAILIALMGLFALSATIVALRTKEIGVRKVLGASAQSILALLCRDFVKLTILAIVLATPPAIYAMNEWLHNFAYHIASPWMIYLYTSILALALVVISVGVIALRATLNNPVKALRSE